MTYGVVMWLPTKADGLLIVTLYIVGTCSRLSILYSIVSGSQFVVMRLL